MESNEKLKSHQHLALALEEHVEEIMEALNIPIEEYGMSASDIRGCAPCHEGDNPSGWIYYFDKGKWFCWTEQCHKEYGSDLLGLIRATNQCTFKEAIQWASDFMKGKKKPDPAELARKKEARTNLRDYWEEHQSQNTYHKSILRRLDPSASYARHRRLSSAIMRKIGAGYARKGKLGGRIVLPVRDFKGRIVGFTGRKIYDNMDGPKWFHHKVKTDINLFNLDRAVKAMELMGCSVIFLVEGPWDAIKMEMAGFPNTVASFGIHLSDGQIEILKRIDVTHVVLAWDSDGPAKKALGRVTKKLEENDFKVSIIQAEEGYDFGDKEVSCTDIRSIVAESCPEIKPLRSGNGKSSSNRSKRQKTGR